MATMRFDDLKSAILSQYDMATSSADSFVPTAALNVFCNRALRRYYALLSECRVDHYNTLQTTITALADTLDTALPTRFHRLESLIWQRGTDDLVTLEPARPEDEYLVGYTSVDWSSFITPRFKMFGSSIRWLPKSVSNQTVYITYVATPGDLTADADTFEAGSGWEQFIIGDVCVMLGSKEERTLQSWTAMREEARQAIMMQAPLRGDTSSNLFLDSAGLDCVSDWDLRNRVTLGRY